MPNEIKEREIEGADYLFPRNGNPGKDYNRSVFDTMFENKLMGHC